MRALDLFCGGGGSSMGLFMGGFKKILGFDNVEQPEYPFYFRFVDVTQMNSDYWIKFIRNNFDFIWASPPCQNYIYATKGIRNKGKKYPDLVDTTRQILLKTRKPFVIENCLTAPIRRDLILCGEMFGLGVIRHRAFEIHGFKVPQPKHIKHRGTIKEDFYVTVAGHGGNGKASLRRWQGAIGIPWITDKKQLAECVPPAYAHYISSYYQTNTNHEMIK